MKKAEVYHRPVLNLIERQGESSITVALYLPRVTYQQGANYL